MDKVYAVPRVNRRKVREFVRANQNILLGWATTFDLAVLYLICLLDRADGSDPLGRQMAEGWIAATDQAAREGVKISGDMLRGLAQAAREAYGVDAEEVVGRRAAG